MVNWLAKLQRSKTVGSKLQALARFRPNFLVPVISLLKALTDPVVNMSMGQTAEELAFRFGISREQMDEFALQSHQLVMQAQSDGLLEETFPLYADDGSVYEQDDGVRPDISLEKLAGLKPAFEKYGNITAGNSSQITDGAALLVLASEEAVEKYQLPVLAQIKDIEWAALDPSIMGLGPVYAMTPILLRNQLALNDIDHMEINEAFAAQVLACLKAWEEADFCRQQFNLDAPLGEMDKTRLNPEGGAIALGHPVGASGARLVLHCAKMMERKNLKNAMASLCIGGGQGGAILLEKAGS
jgi:acetyl-CoA C-acetyltransferase